MITIGFFSNNAWYDKIIKWFENSPITHCAIGFTKDGKQYWLQAAASGVTIVDRGYLGGLCAEFEILPNVQNELEIIEKKVGQPYAYLTLIGVAIVIMAKWFHIGINNPFYFKSAEICSELILEMDANHEISEFYGLNPANVSPADLFDICSKGSSFTKLTT